MLLDAAGVDVIIVQDLGLAGLARELGVRMDVHASTQMTITSPEGAKFAGRLGVTRVVLARERRCGRLGNLLRRGGDAGAGGFCARRAVRGVFGSVPDERGAGAAERESRASARRRAGCRMSWWWMGR